MNRKNNQANSYFTYKNDEVKLSEIGQSLREIIPGIRVKVEWFVLFNKMTGKYVGYAEKLGKNPQYKFRNPDFIILDKETKKIKLVVEDDGNIHTIKMADTEDRNEMYEYAGVPLLPVDTTMVRENYFDYFYQKISKKLEKL